MPNARAQTAASNALAQLSKGLGQPGSIVYGEQRLTVAWPSYSATSIAEELRALGADISTNMAIPARLAGQTTEHVMGVLAGAPLSGTVTLGPNNIRSLEVQFYTAALESDNARLEPAMDMVHAILSAAGRPERILGTYIARQLQNGSPEASQSLAANLAALLADHLTSRLPLENAPALQSAAAVRR